MMSKTIVYIGNDHLSKKKNYTISMEILTTNLRLDNFRVLKYSDYIYKPLRLIHMIYGLIKNAKVVDYVLIDTYSTSNFYFALVCSQISRILRLKYIPILRGGNLPQRVLKNKFLCNLIFNKSHQNVAPSEYLYRFFKERGYECKLIPNTITLKDYEFKKRENFLQPSLLWVRAYAEIYNPLMALEVLRILLKKYPKARLCMIGPDRDGILEDIKKKAKEIKIKDSIQFIKALSKKEWHQKSKDFDIFINTTNFDNTPVSVIEAMALGLPVVSTNVGGIPFLIKDGVNGLLVEPNGVERMVESIEKLLNNEIPNISANARKHVEAFDWSEVRLNWKSILI